MSEKIIQKWYELANYVLDSAEAMFNNRQVSLCSFLVPAGYRKKHISLGRKKMC